MRVLSVSLMLLAGCSWLQPKDCVVYLRYDGGQSKRPYYAIEVCKGRDPQVLCDSDKPLPQPDCPKR